MTKASPGCMGMTAAWLLMALLFVPSIDAAPLKIMPLGDSITRGSHRTGSIPGGYRKSLSSRLSGSGILHDLVGSRTDNPAAGLDPEHNGLDGIRTDQVLANIQSWLAVNPDVVLMKLGTNDMIQKVPVSTAAANLNSLIQQITANAAHRTLFVGTIIPINETRDGRTVQEWSVIINAYNQEVRNLVAQHAGQGRKVILVDFHAKLKYTDPDSNKNFFLSTDGTHPGQAGYDQMGMLLHQAVSAGTPPPPPPPTGPQLVANGSFESGYDGWSRIGNQSVQSGGYYLASNGTKLIAFNAGNSAPGAVLSQTIPTVAGTSYQLAFDAGLLAFNTSTQTLAVTATGNAALLSRSITLTGSREGISRWFPQSFSFVADSGSTTLTFRDASTTTNSLDLLLDNIRLHGAEGGTTNPPVANADSYATAQNTALTVSSPGVLANDAGPQPMTAALVTPPSHGTLTLNGNGGFVYTPAAGYTGSDAFTYRANGGGLASNTSTVSLTIQAVAVGGLVNGSFESGLLDWTATGNVEVKSASPYSATEGSRLVAFNGANLTPNGVISQSFSTTAGRVYQLSFDAGVLSYNGSTQRLQVTAMGTSPRLSQTITLQGSGNGTSRWFQQNFSFTADSTVTTLSFRDVSSSTMALDLLLDRVRVNAAVSAAAIPPDIPEQPPGVITLSGEPGEMTLRMQAEDPGWYVLEGSEDLIRWKKEHEIYQDVPGMIEFPEPATTGDRPLNKFYRIGWKKGLLD